MRKILRRLRSSSSEGWRSQLSTIWNAPSVEGIVRCTAIVCHCGLFFSVSRVLRLSLLGIDVYVVGAFVLLLVLFIVTRSVQVFGTAGYPDEAKILAAVQLILTFLLVAVFLGNILARIRETSTDAQQIEQMKTERDKLQEELARLRSGMPT
jgi:hypothetical protein